MNLIPLAAAAMLALSLAIPPAAAEPPADNEIKAAIYDIDRAEKQIGGVKANQASKIKRLRSGLETAAAQLEKSANKDHASWTNAKARLDALLEQLAAVESGAAAPAQPAPAQQASPQPAPAQPPQPAPNAGGLTEQDKALLTGVNNEINRFINDLNRVPQSDFKKPDVQKRWRDRVQRLKDGYMKISAPNDPEALPFAQKIMGLEAGLEQGIQNIVSGAVQDPQEIFDAINSRANNNRPASPNDIGLTREKVLQYAESLKKLAAISAQDIEALKALQANPGTVNTSNIAGVLNRIGEPHTAELARARDGMISRLESQAKIDWRLNFIAETDPKDQNHRANRLLDGDVRQQVDADLNRAKDMLELAAAFEEAMGVPVKDRSAALGTIEKARADFAAKVEGALPEIRFPKVRAEDPELLAAAKEVLSKQDTGDIMRMAITYDTQRKNSKEGEIDIGAVMITVTTSTYEWDEFGVTTAEKHGDEVYLYWNLLKFYHKGGGDVPTGKWVLAERRRGTRILAENVEG